MYCELTSRGIKIPDGFAITAEGYRHVLQVGGLAQTIRRVLADLDTRDLTNLAERGRQVREAILATRLPQDLQQEITQAYAALCAEYGPETDVAARSSATAEVIRIILRKEYMHFTDKDCS
jgi:pyruvate,water dikinase